MAATAAAPARDLRLRVGRRGGVTGGGRGQPHGGARLASPPLEPSRSGIFVVGGGKPIRPPEAATSER
jgi:hypothetical protein